MMMRAIASLEHGLAITLARGSARRFARLA